MPKQPETPEELILGMDVEELMELLQDMGFEPSRRVANGIRNLVRETGSLDHAIIALHDQGDSRRAA
ncbi:MAG: hypothetical protein AAF989_02995 [Planctomycetota bacterium]